MLQEHEQPDEMMQGLSDQLEGFGIRSAESKQRQLHRRIKEKPVQPSTFYATAPAIASPSSINSISTSAFINHKSATQNPLLMEGDEEDEDSTYEESEEKTSSLETEEFTEGCSKFL